MRKLIIPFLALALALTGCAGTPEPGPSLTASSGVWANGFPANATIGVSLPPKTTCCSSPIETLFIDRLQEIGFESILMFAEGGRTEQQAQIKAMIGAGSAVIIIGAVDVSYLHEELASAKKAGITIIAYGGLLRDTPDVDMYIAFDNCQVGTLQGTALLEGLAKRGDGPFNIELIAGAPDDASSKTFFECAVKVLQPKIDDGTLRIPSGQLTQAQVGTEGWLAANVQERFNSILSDFYSDGTLLDGILSPNDTLGRAAITTIADASLPIPVVTGQDSETESVEWIASGKQYSTIYKNTAVLIEETINLVQLLQKGQEIAFTDTTTFDNGVKIVPAYMVPTVLVTKENVCTAYDPVTSASHAAAKTPFCRGEVGANP